MVQLQEYNPQDKPFGMAPHWLLRANDLSHAQVRTLLVLHSKLGNRVKPWHLTYAWLAAAVTTDRQTVATALLYFQKRGWLTVSGRQQRRKYVLHWDQVRDDLYQDEPEDPE